MGYPIKGFHGRSAIAPEEREFVNKEVDDDENKTFLEIGTLDGVTCGWWALQNPKLKFLTVDPFLPATGTGPGDIKLYHKNQQPNMNLFVGTTQNINQFKDKKYDYIFVDGDHSRKGCELDLEFARTHINENGKIFVHDYGRLQSLLKGVRIAVDDFCSKTNWRNTRLVRCTVMLVEIKIK